MIDKKGQGLSVNAIILIVLGIVVLVLLILGFTLGFGQFKSIRDAFLPTNVGTIVKACEVACSTNSQFDYCSQGRELKIDDATLTGVTCNYLAQKRTDLGIRCSTISCDNIEIVEANAESLLNGFCAGKEGKTIQALISSTNALISYNCPAKS